MFSRATGSPSFPWSRIRIPGHENAPPGSQVRSFALHKDQITGVDVVFAGASNAIFTGRYNRTQKSIVWNPQPEWQGEVGRPSAKGRVSSFAECNGKLYAAVHGVIYERLDGPSPEWKKIFETTIQDANDPAVTGLRGLTSIRNNSGPGEVLLASVEDLPARIYRIDPHEIAASGLYGATLELDVSAFLTQALGTQVSYGGIAYNDTTEYASHDPHCPFRLIGMEVITPDAPETFGKNKFDPRAFYLIRDCSGHYTLREIADSRIFPKPQLVAVRALASRPLRRTRSGPCTPVDSTLTTLLSTTRRGSTGACPRKQLREASHSVAHRNKLQGDALMVIKACLLVAAVVAATATITAAAESARAQTAPITNDGRCTGDAHVPRDTQIAGCT